MKKMRERTELTEKGQQRRLMLLSAAIMIFVAQLDLNQMCIRDSSRPTPEIIVIIVHNLHKTLCLKYPCVGTVCRVPTRLTMPKL